MCAAAPSVREASNVGLGVGLVRHVAAPSGAFGTREDGGGHFPAGGRATNQCL